MTIMLIVLAGVLLLAIFLAILNWYQWGRSTNERYDAKHHSHSDKMD